VPQGRLGSIAVAIAILVGVAGLVGCEPGPDIRIAPDAAAAERIARQFFASAHQSPATFSGVTVGSVTETADHAWRVEIHGDVTEAGSGGTYVSAMILRVDPTTGAVTVEAQG
jgi:hypothetical protein